MVSVARRAGAGLQIALIAILFVPVVHILFDEITAEDPNTARSGPAWEARQEKLARAAVFVPDAPADIGAVDVTRPINDPDPVVTGRAVDCTFVPDEISGTTPKFDCRLPDGRVVKVKYGRTPERHAEVAATRLLGALGFGADRVEFVPELRCRGCPPSPFRVRQVAELFFAGGVVERLAPDDRVRVFDAVSVERKLPGREVEAGPIEGWGWFDLDVVDAGRGGATRAELDALRLVALFLAHWDNKESNQRLTCLDDPQGPEDGPCREPLIMLQDLGATFGPTKVDWNEWRQAPIWTDERTCAVSMATMPYDGGTFVPVEISEAGRQLLVSRLRRLTRAQVTDLFTVARFPAPSGTEPAVPGVEPWVRVFFERVAMLADRSPCPDGDRSAPRGE